MTTQEEGRPALMRASLPYFEGETLERHEFNAAEQVGLLYPAHMHLAASAALVAFGVRLDA